MSTYAVELTEAALTAIRDQAHFIAVERCSPVNAERWLEQVWEAVDSLEQFPRRARLAEENDDVEYEVREIHVGGPALLFTVDRGSYRAPKSCQAATSILKPSEGSKFCAKR